ncbi:MAG: DoxX family protein, partial [Maribacter dokdonensis]
MISKLDNKTLAVHLLRISFGINFLFHGIVRLPNLEGFVTGMQNTFQNTLLPSFLVTPLAYSIPFI